MGSLKSHARGRRWLYACKDRGATAVEYGLMVAFIALAIFAGVTAFGTAVKGLFDLLMANPPFS